MIQNDYLFIHRVGILNVHYQERVLRVKLADEGYDVLKECGGQLGDVLVGGADLGGEEYVQDVPQDLDTLVQLGGRTTGRKGCVRDGLGLLGVVGWWW